MWEWVEHVLERMMWEWGNVIISWMVYLVLREADRSAEARHNNDRCDYHLWNKDRYR
jgi:hypothetical protein